MSAGRTDPKLTVNRDLTLLAPLFAQAVQAALADCEKAQLSAFVYEGYRSQELQALYYARGRTVKPPAKPVTNAPTNRYSWHGFGLAVDVIHRTAFWNPPQGRAWFENVASIFKQHGCKWGGDWTSPDPPHRQWGACKPSPSDTARTLLDTQGIQAVWRAVGAA